MVYSHSIIFVTQVALTADGVYNIKHARVRQGSGGTV